MIVQDEIVVMKRVTIGAHRDDPAVVTRMDRHRSADRERAGQNEAMIEIGVFTDQVDASRSEGDVMSVVTRMRREQRTGSRA
jgi:hypothetical protein